MIVRDTPIFEITIENQTLSIRNAANENDSGIYPFTQIESFEFQEIQINWWVTIGDWIASFLGYGNFEIYRKRNLLILKLKEERKAILLNNCNLLKTKEMVHLFNTLTKKNQPL